MKSRYFGLMRKIKSKTPPPVAETLELGEEDAYANLVLVAIERATDSDKRKLVKAGLIADPNADAPQIEDKSIDAKQAATKRATSRERPPAVSPTSHARVKAVKFLLARANGATFKQAAKELGIEWFDIQKFRWSNPEYSVVYDFVERERAAILAAKASDALESLIDGDASADARNAKAVMFALERLKREQFADPKKHNATGNGDGGGGTVYNISFYGAQPGNLCGVCVGNPTPQPIIDIKGDK